MHKRGWQHHEAYVADLLGLSRTASSGSRWHDPGDGIDYAHPGDNPFSLVIDAKYTEKASKSLKLAELSEWRLRAAELGKRFAMPIRFWPKFGSVPYDFVIIPLDDFAELLELAA